MKVWKWTWTWIMGGVKSKFIPKKLGFVLARCLDKNNSAELDDVTQHVYLNNSSTYKSKKDSNDSYKCSSSSLLTDAPSCSFICSLQIIIIKTLEQTHSLDLASRRYRHNHVACAFPPASHQPHSFLNTTGWEHFNHLPRHNISQCHLSQSCSCRRCHFLTTILPFPMGFRHRRLGRCLCESQGFRHPAQLD